MDTFYEELAETCTGIINSPEERVGDISRLLRKGRGKELVHLSLAKVFKSIVPLYRVRIHSEKVKHRDGELSVSQYDKDLVAQYNAYVREICAAGTPESFRCACELLRTLDHFNFADRIVAKVLIGTNQGGSLGALCTEAIVDRVKNDASGETVFMIINQCLDYRCSHCVVDALPESKYLHTCVGIRVDKEELYNKERIAQRAREKKAQRARGFFARAPVYSGREKKENKQRAIQQNAARQKESESAAPLDDKKYVRTSNALQRLYFTILKENISDCLRGTFIGVRAFIKLIRLEFREGLYVLLNDAVKGSALPAQLEGVRTILAAYGASGLDFKRIADVVFTALCPLNTAATVADYDALKAIIKQLFIDVRQPPARVTALAQRLLQARCMRYTQQHVEMVKMLEVAYDIDFSDADMKTRRMYDPSITDIDKIEPKPFYEYFLFKKMI